MRKFLLLSVVLISMGYLGDKFNENKRIEFRELAYKNQQLAKKGNLEAQLYLAELYKKGQSQILFKNYGIDLYKSAYWYEQAAKNGNLDAQMKIAEIYKLGTVVPKNLENVNYWYYQAALQNHAQAQYELAQNLENGVGTRKDNTAAFQFYLLAAQNGLEDAIYKVGVIYDDGLLGIPENNEQALYWLQKIERKPNDHRGNVFRNQNVFSRIMLLKYPIDASQIQPSNYNQQPVMQNYSNSYVNPTNKTYPSHYYGHTKEPTAQCKDGSFSYSLGRRGVCSGHGGVLYWY